MGRLWLLMATIVGALFANHVNAKIPIKPNFMNTCVFACYLSFTGSLREMT